MELNYIRIRRYKIQLAPYIGLGIFLCGPSAFADEFNSKLKDRQPTIKFISPAEGQIVSPFSLNISWNRLSDPGENIGLVIETVKTGKRIFLGDGNSILGDHHSVNHYSLSQDHKIVSYGFGRFKIIGYHYGENVNDYSYAGIGPEFIVAPRQETFWTKWNEPEKICPKISNTQNYRVEEIKEITCEGTHCVSPKFYHLLGTRVYLDDRPSWLEGASHIIKVTCLPAPDSTGN